MSCVFFTTGKVPQIHEIGMQHAAMACCNALNHRAKPTTGPPLFHRSLQTTPLPSGKKTATHDMWSACVHKARDKRCWCVQ